jgi:hypothetical protein
MKRDLEQVRQDRMRARKWAKLNAADPGLRQALYGAGSREMKSFPEKQPMLPMQLPLAREMTSFPGDKRASPAPESPVLPRATAKTGE